LYDIVCVLTRGQSNLGKVASNALHTLHAQDSLAVAEPDMYLVAEVKSRSRDLAPDPL